MHRLVLEQREEDGANLTTPRPTAARSAPSPDWRTADGWPPIPAASEWRPVATRPTTGPAGTVESRHVVDAAERSAASLDGQRNSFVDEVIELTFHVVLLWKGVSC